MQRSKALDLLARRGVAYRITEFPFPLRTAEAVADALGIRLAQVGKAVLFQVKCAEYGVAVVPGDCRADIGALSRLFDGKPVQLVPRENVRDVLGLPIGAVTPLAKAWMPELHVLIDIQLLDVPEINISIGDPCAGLSIAPGDLVGAVGAVVTSVSR